MIADIYSLTKADKGKLNNIKRNTAKYKGERNENI